MNRFLPLGLCLAVVAFPAPAQEPTKPATEAKAAEPTKAATNSPDLAAKRRSVAEAERALRDARRDMEQAAWTQAHQVARVRDALANSLQRQYYPFTRTYQPSARNSVVKALAGQAEPYGLGLAEADAVLRAQLALPADAGLVVTRVAEKGLADQAGIKLNDVILQLDGQPVGKVDQARAVIAKPGKSFVAVLIREGKPRDIEVPRPEPRTPEAKTSNYWIGVPVAPVDATLRSHLTALPEGAGLIATDVVADSPAAKAGVQKNDILIKFNDKPIGSQEALVEQVQKSEGKEAKLELLRVGTVRTLTLIPEKRTGEAVVGGVVDLDFDGKFPDLIFDGKFPELHNTWIYNLNKDGTTSVSVRPGQPMMTLTPNIPGRTNVGREIEAQVQQDMKALTEQIEQLRKAIEDMKKVLPLAKDPKTGWNSPGSAEGHLAFEGGAFW